MRCAFFDALLVDTLGLWATRKALWGEGRRALGMRTWTWFPAWVHRARKNARKPKRIKGSEVARMADGDGGIRLRIPVSDDGVLKAIDAIPKGSRNALILKALRLYFCDGLWEIEQGVREIRVRLDSGSLSLARLSDNAVVAKPGELPFDLDEFLGTIGS